MDRSKIKSFRAYLDISGLSLQDFCSRYSISHSKFKKWARGRKIEPEFRVVYESIVDGFMEIIIREHSDDKAESDNLKSTWYKMSKKCKLTLAIISDVYGIPATQLLEFLEGKRNHHSHIVFKALTYKYGSIQEISYNVDFGSSELPIKIRTQLSDLKPKHIVFLDGDNILMPMKKFLERESDSKLPFMWVFVRSGNAETIINPYINLDFVSNKTRKRSTICPIWPRWLYVTESGTQCKDAVDVALTMEMSILHMMLHFQTEFIIITADKFSTELAFRFNQYGRKCTVITSAIKAMEYLMPKFMKTKEYSDMKERTLLINTGTIITPSDSHEPPSFSGPGLYFTRSKKESGIKLDI